MYLPQKFITSFMDIILSTLGAFFLLLLILSTNRHEPVQSGIGIPKNTVYFTIDGENYGLNFYDHIGFWIGIEEDDGVLSEIWRSDYPRKVERIQFEDNNKQYSYRLCGELGVSDDDRDFMTFGFWFRELPPNLSAENLQKLKKDGIRIRVSWNGKSTNDVLTVENNFEIALKPGVGPRNELPKVAYTKTEGYEKFPHFNPNELQCRQYAIVETPGRKTRICYDYEGSISSPSGIYEQGNLKPQGYFLLNYQEDNRIPMLYSQNTTDFSKQGADQGLSADKIVRSAVMDAQQLLSNNNDSQNDKKINLSNDDYSKIKFIHVGTRAIVLIMNDNSIKYHMMKSKAKNDNYAYSNWKSVPVSRKDEQEGWKTITPEQIKEMQQQYPDWQNELSGDFIFAFSGVLAQPLEECGTPDVSLPFRRNPLIYELIKVLKSLPASE